MPQTGADREVRRCIYHVPYPTGPEHDFRWAEARCGDAQSLDAVGRSVGGCW